MELAVKYPQVQGDALVSKLYIDGVYQCYILEDRDVGTEHRIPRGRYKCAFRTEGTKNKEYAAKYGSAHHGMIQILVPGRRWIEYHIGNSAQDTLGCNLPGMTNPSPGFIGQSTVAYLKTYPIIAGALLKGEEVWITYDPFPDLPLESALKIAA